MDADLGVVLAHVVPGLGLVAVPAKRLEIPPGPEFPALVNGLYVVQFRGESGLALPAKRLLAQDSFP